MIKKFLFLFLFLCFPVMSYAACGGSYTKVGTVLTAYDSSNECIQAAITDATYNDTVQVPNGNAAWAKATQGCKSLTNDASQTYLCITKAIKLKGGTGIITFSDQTESGGVVYQPDSNSSGKTFELSGFTFNGGDGTFGSTGMIAMMPGSDYITTQFTNAFKIYNNTFSNVAAPGAVIQVYRLIYGVIYKNTFTDVNYAVDGGSASSWGNVAQTYGAATNTFFEDNLINTTKDMEIGVVDPGSGFPGLVYRYNTTDFTNNTNGVSTLWMIHGLQTMSTASKYSGCTSGCAGTAGDCPQTDSCDSGITSCSQNSTMKAEFYGNKIVSASHAYSQWYNQRGGATLMFNNYLTTSASTSNYNINYSQFGCDSCAASGLYTQHITNSYFWANYVNTTLKTMSKNLDHCADYSNGYAGHYTITADIDYFNQTLAFDGTSGMGCGTLATMQAITTCTDGVGFWATDQSCSDLTDYVGASPTTPISGTLYKCSSNTWLAYYTPYEYPHPLRGELPADTTAPTTTISTSNSTITVNSLTVTGISVDAVGVSGCKYRIGSAPDADNGTACTGTTSFSCAATGFASGSNTLYVGCYDAAGNYGSDSITVTFTPPTASGCSFSSGGNVR